MNSIIGKVVGGDGLPVEAIGLVPIVLAGPFKFTVAEWNALNFDNGIQLVRAGGPGVVRLPLLCVVSAQFETVGSVLTDDADIYLMNNDFSIVLGSVLTVNGNGLFNAGTDGMSWNFSDNAGNTSNIADTSIANLAIRMTTGGMLDVGADFLIRVWLWYSELQFS